MSALDICPLVENTQAQDLASRMFQWAFLHYGVERIQLR